MAQQVEVDPFLIDPNAGTKQSFDVPLATDGPRHIAEPQDRPPVVPTVSAPVAPSQQTEVLDDQPEEEIFDVPEGTVTLTHDKKGWHGVLEYTSGRGSEAFHGKTQKELMVKVLAGKANATKQVDNLNRKLKLGQVVEPEPVVSNPTPFQPKPLSANDIFEIKTALESDPDKAADLRFQKKYGMTEAEFVSRFLRAEQQAAKGEEAAEELSIEGVSKEFLAAHEGDYYAWPENGDALLRWLVRNKLRRNLVPTDMLVDGNGTQYVNFGVISGELLKRGMYTVRNLEEALEGLRESGLLKPPPQAEPELEEEIVEPRPAQRRPAVQQPASNTRIVRETRRPRGGLGIRPSSVGTTQTTEEQAPSVEQFDNMTDAEIRQHLAAVRNHIRSTRR
jgi:hypothetical protein